MMASPRARRRGGSRGRDLGIDHAADFPNNPQVLLELNGYSQNRASTSRTWMLSARRCQ
jgi:hypothetical protein